MSVSLTREEWAFNRRGKQHIAWLLAVLIIIIALALWLQHEIAEYILRSGEQVSIDVDLGKDKPTDIHADRHRTIPLPGGAGRLNSKSSGSSAPSVGSDEVAQAFIGYGGPPIGAGTPPDYGNTNVNELLAAIEAQ